MIFKKIDICEKYPDANVTFYLHEEPSDPRPMIVVCPGGGYHFLSGREAAPIAEYYYNAGFNACILRYSIAPKATNYAPLIQVALTVKYVREHAAEMNIVENKIFTCGFSAGGHLAASAGILWNIPEVKAAMGDAPEGINRPDGMVLSYPVITSGDQAHKGSISNLVGKTNYSEEEGNRFSLEKHVDSTTPPMFIWHTVTDTCVPIRNTTMLIDAYLNNGLLFEAHIYPKGPHGLSLANEITWEGNPDMKDAHIAGWIDLAVEWIKLQ